MPKPDYFPTPVNVTKHRRGRRVTIEYPLNQISSINFLEEEVTEVNGESTTQNVGNLVGTFTPENAATEFAQLDTTTGQPTGATYTYEDVKTVLWSLYFHMASQRDAEQQA